MANQEDKFPHERRRAPRVSGAMVEYTIEGGESKKKKAFIKDICIHGVCIYIPESILVGTALCTDIFLFGSKIPVSAKGRVAWQRSGDYVGYHNIGIEFIEMSSEDKKTLADHIDANYKKNEVE